MKLSIHLEGLDVPVSQPLLDLINQQLANQAIEPSLYGFALNFRDTNYSAEKGGFHPVEIGLSKNSGHWQFAYITDFAYAGSHYPELIKEVDFDFDDQHLYTAFSKPLPLSHPDCQDFYKTWESNFLSYVEMGCFDEIQVTAHG